MKPINFVRHSSISSLSVSSNGTSDKLQSHQPPSDVSAADRALASLLAVLLLFSQLNFFYYSLISIRCPIRVKEAKEKGETSFNYPQNQVISYSYSYS